MKNIGLIDDKDKSRRAFMLKLNLELEKLYAGWKVIDSKPFQDPEAYRQWILENEISVMIIDERLDEEKLEDGSYVKYFGSDLVKVLRNYFKDIPIYCITNIEITDHLKNALNYFNDNKLECGDLFFAPLEIAFFYYLQCRRVGCENPI